MAMAEYDRQTRVERPAGSAYSDHPALKAPRQPQADRTPAALPFHFGIKCGEILVAVSIIGGWHRAN
jgi:hypothetical protein